MNTLRWLALLITLGLAACAQIKPFEPVPIDEIPEGPGLLTGEDGEYKISF